MKTIKYILASLALTASLASCVKSLDVTPIDPNKNTADKAFTKAEDYNAFLAGIYTGYATSSIMARTATLPFPAWTAV